MVVNQNRKDVSSLKEVIQAIYAEEVLQTETIIAEIAESVSLVEKIEDVLKVIQDAKFVSRFKHGEDRRKELKSYTTELRTVKSNLVMKVQTAHVGLTRTVGEKLVAIPEQIESLDAKLTQLISGFDGLWIHEVLKDREPDGERDCPASIFVLCDETNYRKRRERRGHPERSRHGKTPD